MYIEFNTPAMLADGRDRSTVRFQHRGEPAAHICILWSERRDQSVIALLTALFHRDRELLSQLVAITESRGRVDFWCRSAEHVRNLQQALEDLSATIHPSNPWKANTGQVVPCTSTGALDWRALPAGHPLLSAAKGHGLGLIIVGGDL